MKVATRVLIGNISVSVVVHVACVDTARVASAFVGKTVTGKSV